MIAGLGTDVVKTERIRLLLEKYGDDFLKKILAEDELSSGEKETLSPERLAGKWAAKEAVAKALGCGFGSSCAVTDIHIAHDSFGAPTVTLSGAAEKRARELGVGQIHISITHEKEYASSVAVLERF